MYNISYKLKGFETEFKDTCETFVGVQSFYNAIQENLEGPFNVYARNEFWQFLQMKLADYVDTYEKPNC